MMPGRPFFEVLGQQDREPVLLGPVLFLGRNMIQSDRRQVDGVGGPKEEANRNADPTA